MRSLKYSAHLCILFVILIALVDSKDQEYDEICQRRLHCQNNCNKAYFPSQFCQEINDIEIHLKGNVFNRFFKYPDPEYVIANEVAPEEVTDGAEEVTQENAGDGEATDEGTEATADSAETVVDDQKEDLDEGTGGDGSEVDV